MIKEYFVFVCMGVSVDVCLLAHAGWDAQNQRGVQRFPQIS